MELRPAAKLLREAFPDKAQEVQAMLSEIEESQGDEALAPLPALIYMVVYRSARQQAFRNNAELRLRRWWSEVQRRYPDTARAYGGWRGFAVKLGEVGR